MSETRSVRLGEDTYARLLEVAGELEARLGRPVSLDEVINYLLDLRGEGREGRGARIMDLAGPGRFPTRSWLRLKTPLQRLGGDGGHPGYPRHGCPYRPS